MKALEKIETRFPQTSYTGLVEAFYNKWTYLQRVTTGNESLYEPIEKAITDDFPPALLGQANIVGNMLYQISLAVKRAGLRIPDPTIMPADNYAASVVCSELLVESLFTVDPLDIVANQKHASNSQKSSKERRNAKELGLLVDLKRGVNKSAAMQMDRA